MEGQLADFTPCKLSLSHTYVHRTNYAGYNDLSMHLYALLQVFGVVTYCVYVKRHYELWFCCSAMVCQSADIFCRATLPVRSV